MSLDSFARSLPMPLKGLGRRIACVIDPILIRTYRRQTEDRRPVPPVALRMAIGAGTSVEHYFRSGERTAAEVVRALERGKRPLTSAGRILDFGCGCGRVTQALGDLVPPGASVELHGSDVNDRAVMWARRHVAAEFRANSFSPPLPYPDDYFDVVLAVSVFTHLDESNQDAWLQDVRRVLKPGGLACLSVGGHELLDRLVGSGRWMNSRDCTRRIRSHRSLRGNQLLFEPYVSTWANSGGMRGTGSGYGMSFHGEEYIRRHWSRWFSIEGILVGVFNGAQDMVLARPLTGGER